MPALAHIDPNTPPARSPKKQNHVSQTPELLKVFKSRRQDGKLPPSRAKPSKSSGRDADVPPASATKQRAPSSRRRSIDPAAAAAAATANLPGSSAAEEALSNAAGLSKEGGGGPMPTAGRSLAARGKSKPFWQIQQEKEQGGGTDAGAIAATANAPEVFGNVSTWIHGLISHEATPEKEEAPVDVSEDAEQTNGSSIHAGNAADYGTNLAGGWTAFYDEETGMEYGVSPGK